MRPLTALIVAGALLGAGAPAHAATVVDFNAFAFDGSGVRYIDDYAFQYGDFKFESGGGSPAFFGTYGRSDPRNPDPGGASVYFRWSATPLTISRIDGAAFDLISLDVADLFNTGAHVTNQFQFNYADGRPTDTAQFLGDSQIGLQTLALNRYGLRSFVLSTPSGQWTQFDNLTVATPVSAVPEPSAWALMIVGFFSLGSVLRMRRRQIVVG